VTIAMRSSSRVSHRRRSRTLFCSRLKDDSMAALAPAEPGAAHRTDYVVAAQGVDKLAAAELRSAVAGDSRSPHHGAHRVAQRSDRDFICESMQ
jgi:hypothetical protein